MTTTDVVMICILTHLDFIRPDLPRIQASEAPRCSPPHDETAHRTEGPTHWSGGRFSIGQPATPLFPA